MGSARFARSRSQSLLRSQQGQLVTGSRAYTRLAAGEGSFTDGRTDGLTDGRTDGWAVNQKPPSSSYLASGRQVSCENIVYIYAFIYISYIIYIYICIYVGIYIS